MTVRLDPAIDVDSLRAKFDAAIANGQVTEDARPEFEAAIQTPEFVQMLQAAQAASESLGRKATVHDPQPQAPEPAESPTYWGNPDDDGKEAFIPARPSDGYSDPSEDTPEEWERLRTTNSFELAVELLDEAKAIVAGSRANDYGENSLPQTAAMWSAYLGVEVTGRDVANMMIQLKTIRDKHKAKRDNHRDIAGYAVLAEHADTAA